MKRIIVVLLLLIFTAGKRPPKGTIVRWRDDFVAAKKAIASRRMQNLGLSLTGDRAYADTETGLTWHVAIYQARQMRVKRLTPERAENIRQAVNAPAKFKIGVNVVTRHYLRNNNLERQQGGL